MNRPLLIIDKEKSYADALATFVERERFEVHVAASREDIMMVMDHIAPEYIIAGVDMPDVDVIGLLRGFKASMSLLQIIILTDPSRKTDVIDSMKTDAFAYLAKPVNASELSFTLAQAREWVHLLKKQAKYAHKLEDLNQASELHRQLFDRVPCYISVQNRRFRITAANRMFNRHFGDGVGEYCYEVYKHRKGPCPVCPVAETFEDGEQHSTEEVVVSKDGERYHVLTYTAPIRDEKGVITQVMEMSTNITLLRQLQSHLEFLGMMLGSVSHGVKGMLTALDGSIYQMETGIKREDAERTEHAFEKLKEVAERIKKMVLDILYYAKSRELDYQSRDIREFAKGIQGAIEPLAHKRGIAFVHRIADSGPFDADPNWFESAIVNILENAVDACADDPDKDEHQVDFEVSISGDDLIFTIQDNGPGMDQETRNKIFRLFFSSKGSKGTGLGLFIANHVVSQHGGEIQVESEPGEGTVFTVRIPRFRTNDEKDNDLQYRLGSKFRRFQ